MWLENLGFAEQNTGWKLVDEGVTQLDGDLPINPSGGVLSTNPIGASGMLRFAEAAMQVRGQAGEHQVEGARRALGHAYGGGSQFFSMWVVGAVVVRRHQMRVGAEQHGGGVSEVVGRGGDGDAAG